jgi:RHS repeat-associated protein
MATTYYPLSDLLYRSTALTDSSGNIQEAYDTDAYGNTIVYSGPGTDDTWFTDDDITTDQPICETIFTGRQYDPETEIYFYRARYYHSNLGRFVSRDPFLCINLYEYVDSSPAEHIDPSGLQSVPAALLEAIAAGDVETIKTILISLGNNAVDTLGPALYAAAVALLAKVAACLAVYGNYKGLNCTKCLPCDTKAVRAAKIACLNTEIALRCEYIQMGCDWALAGSIAIGSQKAQDGHVQQVVEKSRALAKCGTLPTSD